MIENDAPIIDGCRIIHRGDGFDVCRVHHRYWRAGTEMCPGRFPRVNEPINYLRFLDHRGDGQQHGTQTAIEHSEEPAA